MYSILLLISSLLVFVEATSPVLPKPPTLCGPNEHFETQSVSCQITCENMHLEYVMGACYPSDACYCDNGYIRDKQEKCIKREECQPIKCGCNEVVTDCYSSCQPTCKNRFRGDNRVCHTACLESGCVCKPGTLRHDNGTCVPINECSPPRCNDDEVYQTCGTACEKRCDNRGNNCTVCTKQCVEGCFCPEGTVRADNGCCVSPKTCPEPVCTGPNEHFDWCPPTCPHENCSVLWSRIDCRNATQCCKPQCRCKPGHYRKNGVCVTGAECSGQTPKCGPNAHWNSCGTSCPLTCDEPLQRPCTKQCNPSCQCDDGYIQDKKGNCIKPEQCPKPINCTGPNEELSHCYTPCQRTCRNRFRGDGIACHTACIDTGCVCKEGTLRHDNGTCVPIADCSPPRCNPDEVYLECGSACEKTCDNRGDNCTACTLQCVEGCFCPKGTVRAANGSCILPDKCPKPVCSGPNEYFDWCPPNCPHQNCSAIWSRIDCTNASTCCKPQCRCIDGHYRNDSGICISTQECIDGPNPPCGKNAHFNNCSTACPLTCKEPYQRPCTRQCVRGCECDATFVKDANGNCIKWDECPKPPCAANQTYVFCNAGCPTDYCKESNGPDPQCSQPNPCPPGCRCKSGYKKSRDDGRCILESDCPPPVICAENEYFTTCGTACPATCDNPKPEICTDNCVRGCFCQTGLVRDKKSGKCIPLKECPIKPTCPVNETYVQCQFNCPTDYCKESNGPVPQCMPPYPCPPGCRCLPGYLKRKIDGKCIKSSDCPPPVICPKNEHFESCGTACPKTCKNLDPQICTLQCVTGCFCDTGLVRDTKTGQCVSPNQCTKEPTCPKNEHYEDCGTACPKTCDNPDPQICTLQCVQGCFCDKGLVRNQTGHCVPQKQCQSTPICFNPQTEWTWCSADCEPTCENHDPNRICPAVCTSGCICKKGTVKRKDGQCVTIDQCTKEPTCPKNEHYEDCGTACPKTCDNPDPQICTQQCVQGCFCDKGLVRNQTGHCVPQKQCPKEPKCPKNEHYESCGTACPNTCDNPNPKVCTLQCVQGCFCDKGLVRNKVTGKCVSPNQCPIKCKANEEAKKCRIICPPQTCASIYSSYDCTNVTQCEPGCDCINGYLRNGTENDPCIPSDKCPPPTPTCPNNEEWRSCGSACPPTCQERNRTCIKVCKEGCFCKGDLVRNDKGVCVPPKQCPVKVCPINEEWKSCGTACPKTCKNKDIKIKCIAVCKSGCFCKGNRVRNDKGVCVLPSQCPKEPKCPKNEHYESCGTACPNTCDNPNPKICTLQCVQGCFCDKGLVRNKETGKCVSPNQCPKNNQSSECSCPPNEVWKDCGSACPPTCSSRPGLLCPAVCKTGCFCAGNLVRGPDGKCIPKSQCPKTTTTTTTTTTTKKPDTGCS